MRETAHGGPRGPLCALWRKEESIILQRDQEEHEGLQLCQEMQVWGILTMATHVLMGVQDPTGRIRGSYAEDDAESRIRCGSSSPDGQAGYVGCRGI